MDKFDEKVIGYDSIKETLRQIADVLKRPEAYKEKGVSMPRGLLMESAPGLGKSLMASILMEESGRKSFVFRRINEGNTFLGEMKDIFDVAKEEAPSILLLEDLNLYVESNSPYAPEWACLQACIDETSDADIFVIATTNDTRYMPQSLLRPGRFDYILNLNPPLGKTAENIVSYYLRDKNLAKDVQISDIVKAMPQVSCATLETVMNLAAINSVYRDHAHVQKEDIIDALLKVVYNLRKADCEEDPQEHQMIAVHEAAHAVVGEVLHSGSIGIITIRGSHGAIGGMESGFAVYAKSEEEFQDEIIKTLAGKAGTALIYGIMDIRAAADIKKADQLLDIWLCHFAGGGFSGVEPGENRLSEPRLSYNEAIKSAKLEELYRRSYKILYDNRDFLLAVQKELLEHETLLNSDLAKIRESCT
ncbi:AAA family ATPase [Faecalibacterium prausnitzii]|uniref:AAA family ATPase n=1 Tax=Faecalibacterium prausnitzii TaxID=853 RepID=UPI000E468638|nr:AAA family ATPase [Faecalibacterium prausnitzii]RGW78427.1 AAA family ATPase [Faecalibacterium prausnitzii]